MNTVIKSLEEQALQMLDPEGFEVANSAYNPSFCYCIEAGGPEGTKHNWATGMCRHRRNATPFPPVNIVPERQGIDGWSASKPTAQEILLPPATVTREPVAFNYHSLLPAFLRALARLAQHAAEKYGSWWQYRDARLTGEKSPINHIYEHLALYREQAPYDRFDGAPRWHLVAIAYNAMMEYTYSLNPLKFGTYSDEG